MLVAISSQWGLTALTVLGAVIGALAATVLSILVTRNGERKADETSIALLRQELTFLRGDMNNIKNELHELTQLILRRSITARKM